MEEVVGVDKVCECAEQDAYDVCRFVSARNVCYTKETRQEIWH